MFCERCRRELFSEVEDRDSDGTPQVVVYLDSRGDDTCDGYNLHIPVTGSA